MPAAEFEEKQFECAFNNELYTAGPVFASGQILENVTGYDAAADPGTNHVLWRILSVPRPPSVRLVPAHWAPAATKNQPPVAKLPAHPVSFVVQFKRPEYLQGSTAKQYKYWKGPYFRFERSALQHVLLRRLEKQIKGSAVVRYASPAFHRLSDLELAQVKGTVVDSTGFVSPLRLGDHKVWTYVHPGTVGRANPDGEELPFSAFSALFDPVESRDSAAVVRVDSLREHLNVLATASREVSRAGAQVVDGWVSGARRAADIPPDMIDALRDYVLVQSLIARVGATWWLLDGHDFAPTST